MGRLEEQLGAIVEAADYDAWRQVPDMVVALYKKAAPDACRLAVWADGAAGPEDRLWWHADTRTAWAEVFDIEKRADWECLPEIPGVPDAALFIEPIPPPPVEGWILVKAASGYLEPIARPGRAIQAAIGGPNGVTSAIVNGLLGGGLGYGAGWLAEQFLPEEQFEPGHLRNTLGLAGAAIGAAPGLWQATVDPRVRRMPPPPLGFQHSGYDNLPAELTGAPKYPGYPIAPRPVEHDMFGPDYAAKPPELSPKVGSVHPWLYKAADDYGTGAVFMRSIPVDAFNQVVWNDVRNPPNPFGTRSPWGDNSQPMGTPPYAAAATSGLLAGAAQASQSGVVSPWQVGTAAALGAGKGWATGLAAGRVLGVLAGLKPSAQQKLQDVGIWGGLITGVANALFH